MLVSSLDHSFVDLAVQVKRANSTNHQIRYDTRESWFPSIFDFLQRESHIFKFLLYWFLTVVSGPTFVLEFRAHVLYCSTSSFYGANVVNQMRYTDSGNPQRCRSNRSSTGRLSDVECFCHCRDLCYLKTGRP